MKKYTELLNLFILLVVLIAANVVGNNLYTYVDLTEDKRFTLTEPTLKLLDKTDDNHFVTVYLDGEFPASLKRFRDRVEDVLKQFQGENAYINFRFVDPIDGSPEENKLAQKKLVDRTLYPSTINYFDGEENITKPIFPYAVFKFFNKQVIVNLLDVEGMTNYDDVTLNSAEGLLEYKFADAIQKLRLEKMPIIAFTEGNGELAENQIASLTNSLKKYYKPVRLNLDTMYNLSTVIEVLIVAGPMEEISVRNQFMIDQYVMKGGKVIWLVESMDIRLDSIALNNHYIPPLIETGLDNLFFKYGFKILDNTILDLESSKIPQVVGSAGGKPQMDMFKYYYHPLIASTGLHPIVKNIDRVNMFFPSTIDTVATTAALKKTFLLHSSPYSKYQLAPLNLNFRMLGIKPQISKFNRGNQGVALLVEGEFDSAYKNRLTKEQSDALTKVGSSFMDKSIATKMIVISDVDFTKNLFRPESNQITPLGYNKWERKIYKGNRELIINAIEFMLDSEGILASRAKEYKLRLLDEVQVQERKVFWQSLNIAFPLVSLMLFGIGFYFFRRWRYS